MQSWKGYLIVLVMFFLMGYVAAHAQVPTLKGHVNDYASLLNTQQVLDLDKKLVDFEKVKGNPQLVVLTTPNIPDNDIERFANDTFHAWKLGAKGSDNGILVILAPKERKIRIEVGYGYEGDIPDSKAMMLIQTMKPFLGKGKEDWYKAIDTVTTNIITTIPK